MADTDDTTPADVLVFGSLNVDLVCRVASIARPGETVLAPRYEQLFGGKGANQAVAAARMIGGGNRAGTRIRPLTSITVASAEARMIPGLASSPPQLPE